MKETATEPAGAADESTEIKAVASEANTTKVPQLTSNITKVPENIAQHEEVTNNIDVDDNNADDNKARKDADDEVSVLVKEATVVATEAMESAPSLPRITVKNLTAEVVAVEDRDENEAGQVFAGTV